MSEETDQAKIEAFAKKQEEELGAQVEIMSGLIGEKVEDKQVADYLEMTAARWYDRYVDELDDGGYRLEAGAVVEKVVGKGDKYIRGVAEKGSRRYYEETLKLAATLKEHKLIGLNGYYSQELYQDLGVVEEVLRGHPTSTDEQINLSGLEQYRSEVKAHWNKELAKNSPNV